MMNNHHHHHPHHHQQQHHHNNNHNNHHHRPHAPVAGETIGGGGGTTVSTTVTTTTTSAVATHGGGGGGASNSYENTESYSYLSTTEAAILRSDAPIYLPDGENTEEITVNGQKGLWVNRQEIVNWRGPIPITAYEINQDPNPELIRKRTAQQVHYIQELAIRYLKPPSPPPPGEIIIQQEGNSLVPPAPPLIIRQQPPRPITPQPLVIREAPPPPPAPLGRKVITISGKRLPPPPRKVIIERLPPLPAKPQSVIIERWLPYTPTKRRVIYQRLGADEPAPVLMKPRNIIVQWEAPQVVIRKDFKYLGIIRANPVEYVKRYGASLKTAKELPDFVLDIKPPNGVVLAADYQYNGPQNTPELEGDLHALRLIDLDRAGLGEYRAQLDRFLAEQQGQQQPTANNNTSTTTNNNNTNNNPNVYSNINSLNNFNTPSTNNINTNNNPPINSISQQQVPQYTYQSVPPSNTTQQAASIQSMLQVRTSPHSYIFNRTPTPNSQINHANALAIISEIFSQVDKDNNGRLYVDEAEKLLLKLNSRLGRRYTEEDMQKFFQYLNVDKDGTISLKEFKVAFERVL